MSKNLIREHSNYMWFEDELVNNRAARKILRGIKDARKNGKTAWREIGCEKVQFIMTTKGLEVRKSFDYDDDYGWSWFYTKAYVLELEAWLKEALTARKQHD